MTNYYVKIVLKSIKMKRNKDVWKLQVSNREENKYENIIANYTSEQLIIEASIINEQYKRLYNQKKAIEEEMDKRRKNIRKGM